MPSTVGESGYPIKVDTTSDRFRLDFCMFIVEFYRGAAGYNKIYNRLGKVQVYDERIFLEYMSGNQWKQRGTPKDVVLKKINDNHYEVTRTYDDSLGTTYDVTYTVKSDQPVKITIKINSGQNDTYRVAWQLSGIVDPNTDSTLTEKTSKANCVYFGDDREDSRNYICFDWSDVSKIGIITEPSYSDAAKGRKATITFNIGVINAGETKKIDPSTVGTSTLNDATLTPPQRKSFFAAGRFWAFHADGTNMVYATSTDGVSWSSPTTVQSSTRGFKFSIVFDGTYVHYVFGDAVNDNVAMTYRRGTPNSDGTITWSAVAQTVLSAIAGTFYKYPTIAIDTNGYPWISYAKNDGTYEYPYVIKSSTNDGTWSTAGGFPYQLSTTSDLVGWRTTVVALTSSKMLVIYVGDACNWYAQSWTGSAWNAEVNSQGSGGSTLWSAVADGDNAHVAHRQSGGDHYNLVHTKYTYSTNSFSALVTLQLGADLLSVPVLSLNTATGDLYCLWAGTPTANHIYYKKRTSGGTWDTDPTDWIDESTDVLTDKDRLTCFYQAYSSYIGLMYMTKTASPYNVRFAFLTLAQTYYQNLPATEVSIAIFIRSIGKGMTVSEVSLPSLTKTATFYRTLAGIASSVATLGKAATHFLALTVAEVSSTILAKLATFYRSLSATEIGAPSLTRIITFLKSLSVMESSSATLSKVSTFARLLSVAESSVASLSKKLFQSLSVIEVSIASIQEAFMFYLTLAATATGIATLQKITTFLKSLVATAGSSPIISKLSSFYRFLYVVEVSNPSLSRIASYFRTLSVIVVSQLTLLAQKVGEHIISIWKLIVGAEDRILVVPFENRVLVVPFEDRTLVVE